MPGREGSRCLTRQEQVASYSRALVTTAATATTLRAAVMLRRMSLSRSRVFPGVCTKAHEGVFQGAPREGAHTSPPSICCLNKAALNRPSVADIMKQAKRSYSWSQGECQGAGLSNCRIGITLLFIENAWWDTRTRYFGGSNPHSRNTLQEGVQVLTHRLSKITESTSGEDVSLSTLI